MSDPVKLLRRALADVERGARRLPWSGREGDTWTVGGYVRDERGIPTVDLHDLDRDLARTVVEEVLGLRGQLGPTVRLITGRGRHSQGGRAVLREVVREQLRAEGVSFDDRAPGHLDVHLVATGGFWVMVFKFMRGLLRLAVGRRSR